jgi:hypothetical protein
VRIQPSLYSGRRVFLLRMKVKPFLLSHLLSFYSVIFTQVLLLNENVGLTAFRAAR